jgi:hypothetical protein
MMQHRNPDVQRAITALTDALCEDERITGIQNVLIIRDQVNFEHRALSGKPGIPDFVDDAQLLDGLKQE